MFRVSRQMIWAKWRLINNRHYADDIVLIATSSEDPQKLLDTVYNVWCKFGLEISTQKTKVTMASKEKIKVNNGELLEQVHSFCCLGSIITDTGDQRHKNKAGK